MSWPRSLFVSHDEIARLRAERDIATEAAAELKTKLEASEARLVREINSNRRREDALMGTIVEISTGQTRMPFREEIGSREEGQIAMLDAVPADKAAVDADFERAVQQRVRDFAEQAKLNGLNYDREGLDILEGKIRNNPSEYLDI